jgi:hypothetical protein
MVLTCKDRLILISSIFVAVTFLPNDIFDELVDYFFPL